MKKLMVVLTAAMVAAGAQAAVMNWGTTVLQDNGGAFDSGTGYALPGVDLYLIYNGVSNSDPLGAVTQVGGVLNFGGTLVSSTTSTPADYSTGGFERTESVVDDLNWFGDLVGSWEDMNLRTFTVPAVSDADGDYASGATYGFYTGNPVGFSTATGVLGTGTLSQPVLDASGMGELVPEPATIGLMGIAGLGMFLARKKVRI